MKSIVMALFLFTNCIASLLALALVSVTVDPKLTWMYTGIACTAGVCTLLVWIFHHKNDAVDVQEDSIVRDKEQLEAYNAEHKQAITEYEVEKGAV